MGTYAAGRLVSHQDYSAYESERRCIPIDLKSDKENNLITHFVEFKIKDSSLSAYVHHRQPDLAFSDLAEVPEQRIYYVSDRSFIHYDAKKLPKEMVPLSEMPNRQEILQQLSDRAVVVANIFVDHEFYKSIATRARQPKLSKFNESYIVIAPEVERNTITPSPELLPDSHEIKTPTSYQELS